MDVLRIGDVVPGTQLKIIGLLGQGGQGTVYEAQHLTLLQPRVVKVLNISAMDRGDNGARIVAEAQMLAAIHHPNIVPVIDAGLTQELRSRPFFVMPKLDGMTLHEFIRRKRAEGGVSVQFALVVIEQLCSALDLAHVRHQLIHRDIKPANVMLVRTSQLDVAAVLLDFGIAKIAGGGKTGRHIIGTLQYMPPEQIEGRVGPRSDLYNIGLLMFEMIAGRHAFAGCQTTAEWAEAHLHRTAPRLSSLAKIDRQLDQLVAQLLEKDPNRRPANAHAVEMEVRAIRQRLDRDAQELVTPQGITQEMPFSAIEAQMGLENTALPQTPTREPTASTAPGPQAAARDDAPEVAPRLPNTTSPTAALTYQPPHRLSPVDESPPTQEVAPIRRQFGRSNPAPSLHAADRHEEGTIYGASPRPPESTRRPSPSGPIASTTGATESEREAPRPILARNALVAVAVVAFAVAGVAVVLKLKTPSLTSTPSGSPAVAVSSSFATTATSVIARPTPVAPVPPPEASASTAAPSVPVDPQALPASSVAVVVPSHRPVAAAAPTTPAPSAKPRRPGSGLDGPPPAQSGSHLLTIDKDMIQP